MTASKILKLKTDQRCKLTVLAAITGFPAGTVSSTGCTFPVEREEEPLKL